MPPWASRSSRFPRRRRHRLAASPVRSAPSPVALRRHPQRPFQLRNARVVPPATRCGVAADRARSSAARSNQRPDRPHLNARATIETAGRDGLRREWILLVLMIVLANLVVAPGDSTITDARNPHRLGEETTTLRQESSPPVVESAPETPAISEAPTTAIADAPEKPAATKPSDSRSVRRSRWRKRSCAARSRHRSGSARRRRIQRRQASSIFYTRVKSARDTTVQHRWLMNGHLVRSVDLRVGANPGAGYRTYSRNTIDR